jgi:hypothetical protein
LISLNSRITRDCYSEGEEEVRGEFEVEQSSGVDHSSTETSLEKGMGKSSLGVLIIISCNGAKIVSRFIITLLMIMYHGYCDAWSQAPVIDGADGEIKRINNSSKGEEGQPEARPFARGGKTIVY